MRFLIRFAIMLVGSNFLPPADAPAWPILPAPLHDKVGHQDQAPDVSRDYFLHFMK